MIHSDIRAKQSTLTRAAGRAISLALASGTAISAVGLMGGCEWDSFLRTNAVGRWEKTTSKVPILTRIAAIEDENGLAVDAVAPSQEDLYPDPREYRIGPGDELDLEIYDIVATGSMTPYTRRVDVRGMVNIPQLGDVFVNGKTVDGVRDAIGTAMKKLVDQPLVGVNVKAERQQTFVIQGAVDQPGPYFIPSPDYKLLEALTAGGRMPTSVSEVYVIRQVPLDERVDRATTAPLPPPKKGGSPFDAPIKPDTGEPAGNEPGLMDILKDLSQPKTGEPPAPADTVKPMVPPPAEAPKELPKDAPIDLPASTTPIAPVPVKPVVPPPAPAQPAPATTPKEEPKSPAPAPVVPPKENEPPVPLPEPGMMSEFAPPKDADEMARRARLKALESKLKHPLDTPAPPRTPKPGEIPPAPQPEAAPDMAPIDLPEPGTPTDEPMGKPMETPPARTTGPANPALTPSAPTRSAGPDAVVDLPEVNKRQARPAPVPTGGESTGKSSWVYLNGRWVQVRRSGVASGDTEGLTVGGEPVGLNAAAASGPLFAQKVIKVPLDALFRGDSNYNIVIRPGDVIRVPPPPEGEVYVAGQVVRPGSYQLSQSGGAFTVTRAIVAAGGLGDEAIPERVDLVRVVGNNQQATMRIDLRAMYEGTQPDILLKKDDMINVGSNFWAFPLAVIRNGFRANYGFGLILDRNFGSDVFGVPPESRSRNSF